MKFLDRIFGRAPNEVAELHAEVAVGDAFKTWAQSDIGRYIIGRAEQYELETLRTLAGTDPMNAERIFQLQADAKAPALLLRWIEEAMFMGEQARFQLMEAEERIDR
jgi:hypothetical protein